MTFTKLKKKYCCMDPMHNKDNKTGVSQEFTLLSESCHSGPVKICKVTGDRKLCARMAALGVYPGEEIELVCPRHGGSQCLLKVHGSTLSLDQESIKNILVTTSL